ncbi:hypothetical protein LCGC14_2521950 [marine sediment metagenome]|uniref:Adenine methyltransferase n=1 Tax=marine sediment metagenome TaxID=412755 RepID=A0A0F9DPH2_9ZZZZ
MKWNLKWRTILKMFNTKGLMSSKRKDWKTPRHILDYVEGTYGEFFDPCPSEESFDGLKIEWKEVNFVNPPYGTEIKKWIEKGYKEWKKGKTIIFLIPSRTDTRWWHDYVMEADEIYLIKGRLCFDDSKRTAPFPSCLAIFDGENSNPNHHNLKVFPLIFNEEENSA